MGYDQLIRRMKRIYLNDKEGVLQLQSEIAKDCNRAGNAIRELLARAEKAEARARELETSFRTEKCENGPECVELGRARKKAEKAEERAEKVERERDAAVEQLRGDCEKCANYKVTWNGCTPDFECPLSDRCLNRDMWEWNGGQKEE